MKWSHTQAIKNAVKALLIISAISTLSLFTASAADSSPARRFNAGVATFYSLDYSNRSSSDMQQVFDSLRGRMGDQVESYTTQGLQRSVRVTAKGELRITPLETTAEHAVVQYRIANLAVSVVIDGQRAIQEEKLVKQAFYNGIIGYLSLEGTITGLALPLNIKPTPSGIIRALIAHTQVILPTEASSKTAAWETVEEDLSGKYRTTYTPIITAIDSNSSLYTVVKSRHTFLTERSLSVTGQQSIPVHYQPSGSFTVIMDKPTGDIRLIRGNERVKIRIDTREVGTSETSLDLQLLRREKLKAKSLAALRKQSSPSVKNHFTRLSEDLTREENNRMLYRQKLGDDTLETLLSRLTTPPSNSGDETELFLKFRALIYLMPDSCKKISVTAQTASPESHTARILVSALSSIGSLQAQDALIAIARSNSNNPDYFIQLLSLLGLTENPGEASERFLHEYAYNGQNKDSSTTALLALGNMAHRLAARFPKRAELIISNLLSIYGSSNDEDVITTTLAVLGNAAHAGQLTRIIEYSKDARPAVRKEAASALRFYPQATATATILTMLESDSNTSVRLAAVEAFGFQEMDGTTIGAISAAYSNETDENVRGSIIKLLGKLRQKFPAIIPLLEDAHKRDTSEKVRNIAKELLISS